MLLQETLQERHEEKDDIIKLGKSFVAVINLEEELTFSAKTSVSGALQPWSPGNVFWF